MGLSDEMVEQYPALARSNLKRDVTALLAAVAEALRDEDAVAIGELLIDEFDDVETRLAVVETVLEHGRPGPAELRWAASAAAEANGPEQEARAQELLERLAEAFAEADASDQNISERQG